MLERTTACLNSGATRESLRRAQGVRRSKRLLHSAFWNHGAGVLDLPAWMMAMGSMGGDSTLDGDNINLPRSSKRRETEQAVPSRMKGIVLDFLYPPQALAWLQRKQEAPLRNWERRNMSRLPRGYIVASKRYASSAYRPFASEQPHEDVHNDGKAAESRDTASAPKQYRKVKAPFKLQFIDSGTAVEGHESRSKDTSTRIAHGKYAQTNWGLEDAESDVEKRSRVEVERHGHKQDIEPSPWGLHDGQQSSMTIEHDFMDLPGELALNTLNYLQKPNQNMASGKSSGGGFSDSPGELAEQAVHPIESITSPAQRAAKHFRKRADMLSAHNLHETVQLADVKADPMKVLRNIFSSSQTEARPTGTDMGLTLTNRAWTAYRSLSSEAQLDVRLKQEFMGWLSCQENEVAAMRCNELYRSIPKSSRTFEVYKAGIALFTRHNECEHVSELHKEALQNLENGYLISRLLFKQAVDGQKWQLAMDTAVEHNTTYTKMNDTSQVRVFWLYVSELSQLLSKAIGLTDYLGGIDGLRAAPADQRDFCLRFFKEAVSQEFLPSDVARGPNEKIGKTPLRRHIRAIFQHIMDMDAKSAGLVEQIMFAAFHPGFIVDYPRYHHVFSYVYQQYCALPGVTPSEDLLFAFLCQLGRYWPTRREEHSSEISVDVETLTSDWKKYHDKLDNKAVQLLLSQYARFGEVEKFDDMAEYQRSVYPAYEDQRSGLWTTIYLHARRADLDMAQQAFSEIQRIAGEHGEKPDLRCWNVLLHAHMRVDDLEGALTNFHNLIHHAKLRPDSHSFSPLFHMMAKRGDVAALEELYEQYHEMVGDRLSTESMLSLMIAHFNNDDNAEAAEKVLHDIITKRNEGEVLGTLTSCFNALMGFHAVRRDVDATMRIYRWMRVEKVRLDGETFGALIQALLHYRQAGPAYKILSEIMPEHGIRPTAYHYALLMAGMTKQKLYRDALNLHRKMTRANIKPTLGTHVNYLKAKAAIERDNTETSMEDPVPLESTLRELQHLVSSHDASHVASGETMSVSDKLDLDDSLAPYFDFLIYIHGERRCYEAAKQLFDQYRELSGKGQDGETIPIRMLSALMSVHHHANEHDKVEEYWKLAKRQADELARTVQLPHFALQLDDSEETVDPLDLKPTDEGVSPELGTSMIEEGLTLNAEAAPAESKPAQPKRKKTIRPKLSPARKHILDRPLQWYLKTLASQARIPDAITVVSQLLAQGYILGKRTWNLFIRTLLDSRPPLTLLAFLLTERFMISHFPGWSISNNWPPRPASRTQGLEHMRTRYINRQQIIPEYRTLARLAAALLDLTKFESSGRGPSDHGVLKEMQRFVGTGRGIRSVAPKTVNVVQSMPAVPDSTQAKLLSPARR